MSKPRICPQFIVAFTFLRLVMRMFLILYLLFLNFYMSLNFNHVSVLLPALPQQHFGELAPNRQLCGHNIVQLCTYKSYSTSIFYKYQELWLWSKCNTTKTPKPDRDNINIFLIISLKYSAKVEAFPQKLKMQPFAHTMSKIPSEAKSTTETKCHSFPIIMKKIS
jgi:hypothetical protein